MKALQDCRLYTFVDSGYLRGRDPVAVTQELCEGGSDLIQLRAKDRSLAEIRRIAEAMVVVTEKAGVGLVINDYPEIAREIGAPLAHLGQEDFVSYSGNQPIGLSTHAPAEAQRAVAARPAYIAVGPVYTTGTKPTAKPVTLEYVRWASGNVHIPWFAIGGINLENLDEVLAAGARRVCVVSAILNSPEIARTCQMFRHRLSFAALK